MSRAKNVIISAIVIYLATGALFSIVLPEIYTSLPQWAIELISIIYEPVFVTLFGSF